MNNNSTTKIRAIAYIDILGFRNKVGTLMNGGIDNVVREYREILSDTTKSILDIKVKWFSDTIVLYSQEHPNLPYPDLYFLSMDIAALAFSSSSMFLSLLMQGYPTRGAIAIGEMFIDESNDIYVGPALIEAYEFSECQKWAGISFSPESYLYMKKNRIKEVYDSIDNKYGGQLIECNVPVKTKNDVKTYVVNWTQFTTSKGWTSKSISDNMKKYTDGNNIDELVQEKIENTVHFFEKDSKSNPIIIL